MFSAFRFLALTAMTGLFLTTTPVAQAAEMDKTRVEQIVEQYIMDHPEVILNSVNEYQRTGMAKEQASAIARNKRKIFQNSLSPVAGDPDGDITVVEFFDYNCGYCKRVVDDVNKLITSDNNVKVIFKEFPILGPTSETAARWALAAHNQNKYVEFHTAVMNASGRLDEDKLIGIANDLDLNIEKMRKDAQSQQITDYIEETRALAQEIGITGTPGFIVEDEVFPGAIEYDSMQDIIADKRAEKEG